MKVRVFPYFKILNFQSDDVTFLRNAETAILTKNERENTTTLVALTRTTLSKLKKSKLKKTTTNYRGRSELQLLCCYNSCKAVASNGEGWKPAFRVIVKSNLRSLIHRIQEFGRVSGRKTFIDSRELLASCHVLT